MQPLKTNSVLTVYLPTSLALVIERLAQKRGESRSAVAKELLKAAIERETTPSGRTVTVRSTDQAENAG